MTLLEAEKIIMSPVRIKIFNSTVKGKYLDRKFRPLWSAEFRQSAWKDYENHKISYILSAGKDRLEIGIKI